MEKRKIIVLTPVKNEEWILNRFLQVTSQFADHIIIADQNSTDRTIEICNQFPKVVLVKNINAEYDEASRQILLINKARELFGIGNILLAIDADEILAANAIRTFDWERMLNSQPGTILYFEKPTLYKNTGNAIRYLSGGWPLGYIDDGAPHAPKVIHSTRVPTPDYAQRLYLNNIKFIHYALVRLRAQASKQRMYSMLENINGTKPVRERRRLYDSRLDFSKEGDRHEAADKDWFLEWEKLGIDMHTIPQEKYYWYDFEALRLFKEHGVSRFERDDIWEFDWESCRKDAIKYGLPGIPGTPINPPGKLIRKATQLQYQMINSLIEPARYLKNIAIKGIFK